MNSNTYNNCLIHLYIATEIHGNFLCFFNTVLLWTEGDLVAL